MEVKSQPETDRRLEQSLVEAATRAPSGDNTQPWTFAFDADSHQFHIRVDENGDRSVMNAGQRMSRIAVGAAAENILTTARHNGWTATLQVDGNSGLTIAIEGATETITPCKSVQGRVTNRKIYSGAALETDVLQELQSNTPEHEASRTIWIADASRINELAKLIAQCDALLFTQSSMRSAFFANVRFDRPASETVDKGLSLDSLELNAFEARAFGVFRKMPNWLWRMMGLSSQFGKRSQQLAKGASALAIVSGRDRTPTTDFATGLAMQRAWLAATEAGLAVQPMMSLMVLENAVEQDVPLTNGPLVKQLLAAFHRIVPEVSDGRPSALLRVGFATPPTGRTGRQLSTADQ